MTPKLYTGIPSAGLWTMPAHVYHADPCVTPSLSSGALNTLLESSPLHVYNEHPRYGNNRSEGDRKQERGSVVHRLVLDEGPEVAVLQFNNYKSKAAQDARDEAEASHKLPVLEPEYELAKGVAGPLREALEDYMGAVVADCYREVVVLWQVKGGGWRRARIDIVRKDFRKVGDIKSIGGTAAPIPSASRIFDRGYDVQAAFYLSALDFIDPAGAGLRNLGFLFGECAAPFAVSPPIELSEGALHIARQKVEVGGALFDSCVKSDLWPAYEADVHVAQPPPWYLANWEARMQGDHTLNPVQA